MTRDYVERAMKEGYPFEINMADGKSYRVNDEYSIALIGNTAVIVVEDTLPRILPLLTVTGISYLKPSPPESPNGESTDGSGEANPPR